MNEITVILLTFNEERQIKRCIQSLRPIASAICVIDSCSTDCTCELAERLGPRIFQHKWVNYSKQFNWTLINCSIETAWTTRMDCDEYLLPELIQEINQKLPHATPETGSYILKRHVYFTDCWIKHGEFYPHRLLRLWRTGRTTLEDRWMDEHAVLSEGTAEALEHDLVDHNLNNLT